MTSRTRRTQTQDAPAGVAEAATTPLHSNQAAVDALPEVAAQAPETPWLHRVGEGLGLGLGFLVTEALALVPGWTDDLLDEDGQPVQAVDGAVREGDYNLEKRHTKVVGPQIEDYADDLRPGPWRDFVSGLGDGASDAPGASYRFEAAIAEHFDD